MKRPPKTAEKGSQKVTEESTDMILNRLISGTGIKRKDVNVIIPLNRYSLFEELEGNMLPPMQLQFNIELNDGDELIQRANAADAGRVVVNRFQLMVPKLTPKDSMYDKFVYSFLKQTEWN